MAGPCSLYENSIMAGVPKFLLTLWIILIVNRLAFAQLKTGSMIKSSICKGKNGILMPMFGKCRGYYICNDGKAVAGSCDEGSQFNPLTLHCDNADNVICPYETSGGDAGDDDDDNDTDNDIDNDTDTDTDADNDDAAVNDDELEMDASIADDFDSDSDEFEKPPVIVKPTKRPVKPNKAITPNQCLGKKNGITLPKAGSCSEYFICKSKKPQLRRCPGRQQFSPTRRLCMRASQAKCDPSPEPEEPKPAITAGLCSDEKQDALVPHQGDCSKFLLCSNMLFLVMDCPQGLHFNAQAKRCDYPKVAQCNVARKTTKRNKKKLSNKRKPKSYSN